MNLSDSFANLKFQIYKYLLWFLFLLANWEKKLFWTIWWVCYSKNSPFLDDDATGLTAIKWKDLDGNCFAMLQKKKSSGGRRFGRQDDAEEVTEAAAPAETTVADR